MPTVPTLPSMCTYSWLLAYLLSSGVIESTPSFGAFVERRRDNARSGLFSSDQDAEFRAWRRFSERKIREADRFFQRRRMRPAGDHADLFLAVDDWVAVAADAALDHLESHQLPARSLGLLALQDVAAVEVALLQLDDPSEVRLQRGGGVVDVVAVQGHLGLEAQRVARAEAAGLDAGVDQFLQDARTVAR